MKCTSCGNELLANAKFCTICGTPVPQEPVAPVAAPEEKPPVQPVAQVPEQPVPPVRPVPPVFNAAPVLPRENRPLSPWAYFGLQLLFSIPLVGFICLIVFSLDDGNINRRNFARSYWCSLILCLVLTIALVVLLLVTGAGAAILSELEHL